MAMIIAALLICLSVLLVHLYANADLKKGREDLCNKSKAFDAELSQMIQLNRDLTFNTRATIHDLESRLVRKNICLTHVERQRSAASAFIRRQANELRWAALSQVRADQKHAAWAAVNNRAAAMQELLNQFISIVAENHGITEQVCRENLEIQRKARIERWADEAMNKHSNQ